MHSLQNVTVTGPNGQSAIVQAPSIANVSRQYAVTLNQYEQTRATLYDGLVYPAAGTTQLSFFALPQGQGTSVLGAGTKTLSDTNLQLAGQLPATQRFLIERVTLKVQPSTPSGSGIIDPAYLGAPSIFNPINDVWYILRSGNLSLKLADKIYVQEAPLDCFPPTSAMRIDTALAQETLTNTGNTTGNNALEIGFAQSYGMTYDLDPDNLLIDANMSFGLTLNWPEGVQAIQKPARIFARLEGTLFRQVQ
jgi:hypothetical protein